MKHYLLLFLFHFLFFNVNAQELVSDSSAIDPKLLLGNWGLDYVDYGDGTRVKNNYVARNAATMLLFRKSKALTAIYHFEALSMLYWVMNNTLFVGDIKYKIEKLTKNELVFSSWEDIGRERYQVLRYHYLATKESSEQYFLRNFVIPNIRIKPNKDTVYAFSEDFFPHYVVKFDKRSNYGSEYKLDNSNDVFQASYQTIERAFDFTPNIKGCFHIQFDVTKTGQLADVIIKESSDSVYNNQLIKAVMSTAKSWENAEYQNKPIAVQFNYIFEYDGKEDENDNFDPLLYESFMERADKSFEKKNYDKAIKFYTKCILMTDDTIEALYKRADCYFTVNAVKNACSDWNYLATKGHKRAEELYLRHCMK